MKTSFLPGNFELSRAIKNISKEIVKMCNDSLVDAYSDRAIFGSPNEAIRFLVSYKTKSNIERTARSFLLRSVYLAEKNSPSSAYLLLTLLSGKKIESTKVRKLNENDMKRFFQDVGDSTIESILKKSVELAGVSGNISVSVGGITHIAVDESAIFPVIVSPSFKNLFSMTKRKIVVYDGVIETVGEINKFLEDCSFNKSSVLLVARSFSTEVASTIYANNERKAFDILPITPGVDIEDQFTLYDIASISNVELQKKISIEDSKEIDVIIENNKLKLQIQDVSGQEKLVKQLSDDLNKFKDHETVFMIKKRIIRASSRRISVCIGEEFSSAKDTAKDKFDYGMRKFLSARKFGVIEINNQIYPGQSFEIAKKSFDSIKLLVEKTGGSLVIEKMAAS